MAETKKETEDGKGREKWGRSGAGEKVEKGEWEDSEMDWLNILRVQECFPLNSSRLPGTSYTVYFDVSLSSKQSQTLRVGGVEAEAILGAECSTSA